eukprot:CAMPEP_0201688826 /NCGR_PEP_ID=MMETSP0578-20130828/2525_1 /ASSEMBLY_ACC=CAM_ASM_000663 /TAXON_ID=267565 /ORGANISM="Skeletonema grethea, Strain CCMP 1804" /LENGTH=191 /DNA_ID=CAMNT_0048173285 /DNA_START=142 /DNA_END=717 /DNA_ORIENTATION=+
MTDRQQRTERAMGEAMYQMAMSLPDDVGDYIPFSYMVEQEDRREKQLDELSEEERVLLKELCSFFDFDHMCSKTIKREAEVFRAKKIIEELELNVNFPVLAYGETFLNQSINHSLDMVTMLIQMGADVNAENQMMAECALDGLLEEEDNKGTLSDEKKAMKKLLLSKGAKTPEERWMDKADEVSQMNRGRT